MTLLFLFCSSLLSMADKWTRGVGLCKSMYRGQVGSTGPKVEILEFKALDLRTRKKDRIIKRGAYI